MAYQGSAKQKATSRAWASQNRDKRRADGRKSYAKRRSTLRELRIANPEQEMLTRAKKRAVMRNVPFDLDVRDIVIPEVCPVLGIWLESSLEKAKGNSPSLDRIIPEKGYVKGNVIVISHRANQLKSDASLNEMEALFTFYSGLEG